MACNNTGKVLLGVGCVGILIGAILLIVAGVNASQAAQDVTEIKFIEANKRIITLTTGNDKTHLGWSIYIKEDADCTNFNATVTVPGGDTYSEGGIAMCTGFTLSALGDAPKLKEAFHLSPKADPSNSVNPDTGLTQVVTGTYKVAGNQPMWANNWNKHVTDFMESILGSIVMVILAIAVAICGSILCCVGGCCCQPPPPPPAPGGPVVGQPVGQPMS